MADTEVITLLEALEEVVVGVRAEIVQRERVDNVVLYAVHDQLKHIRSRFYSLYKEREAAERRERRVKKDTLKFQETLASAKEFLAKDAAVRNAKQSD